MPIKKLLDINKGLKVKMRILLGICGQMGSGKSLVAEYLEEKYNFKRFRLSSKMREIAIDLGLEPSRNFLQGIGKFMRDFDDDVWVKYLIKMIINEKGNIVVDDIRRINEVKFLKPQGFVIIRIESTDKERKARIEKRTGMMIPENEWFRWQNHLTEIQVKDIPVDNIIVNNGTIKHLKKEVDHLMDELLIKNNR